MTTEQNKSENIITTTVNRIRKRRFVYLAISLLLLIITYPYVQGDMGGQILLSLFTTVVMIMSVIAVGDKRSHTIVALVLAAPWFLLLLLKFPLIPVDTSDLVKDEIVFAFLLFSHLLLLFYSPLFLPTHN